MCGRNIFFLFCFVDYRDTEGIHVLKLLAEGGGEYGAEIGITGRGNEKKKLYY